MKDCYKNKADKALEVITVLINKIKKLSEYFNTVNTKKKSDLNFSEEFGNVSYKDENIDEFKSTGSYKDLKSTFLDIEKSNRLHEENENLKNMLM